MQRLAIVRGVKYEEITGPAGVDTKEAAKVRSVVSKSASRLAVFWLKHLLWDYALYCTGATSRGRG